MRGLLAAALLVGAGLACLASPSWLALDPDGVEVPAGLRVSDGTYRAAYAYAAERVGPAAFQRLYRVDPAWTAPMSAFDCTPSCLTPLERGAERVAFDLVLPNGTHEPGATVTVAADGSVVPEPEQPYYGFPDCRSRPDSCVFRLEAQGARRAAQRQGLEPRGCPLDAQFGWDADLQRHAWHVTAPRCPTPRVDGGTGFTVDAATGGVVARYGWSAVID